mgnify:CR=1 FL=1
MTTTVRKFSDSETIAKNLRLIDCDAESRYWTMEAATHIEAMYAELKLLAKSANSKENKANEKLIRIKEVLQILPIGRSSFLAGVKQGVYPQPVKLGPSMTCWKYSEILELVDGLAEYNGTKVKTRGSVADRI